MPAKTPNALLHGTLDALILKTLAGGPRHGYAIAKFIEDASAETVIVEEGSLYPALYRMERRGWLEAEWGESELGRRAKLYRLTRQGRAQLAAETAAWRQFAAGVSQDPAGPVMKRSLRSWLWRVPLDQEVDEELALHIELRTRELVERGLDPKTARDIVPVAHRRPRATQTHVCGPWQKERPRDAHDAVARRTHGGCEVCAAPAERLAGLHGGRRAHARARHRRQQRDVRAGRRDVDSSASLSAARSPGDDLAALTRPIPRAGVSPTDLRDWEEQSRSFEVLGGDRVWRRRRAAPRRT